LLATPILLLTRLRDFLFVISAFGILIAVLSLQYALRHAFYMSLMGASIFALSGSALLDIARYTRVSGFHLPPRAGMKAGSLLVAAVLDAASLAAASKILAVAQRNALQDLVATYTGLQWEPVRFHADQSGITPEFTGMADEKQTPSFAPNQATENRIAAPRPTEAFSRVTTGYNQKTCQWQTFRSRSPGVQFRKRLR
jgi:hypothetical protein